MYLLIREADRVIETAGDIVVSSDGKKYVNNTLGGQAWTKYVVDIYELIDVTIDDIPQEVQDLNLTNTDLAVYISYRYKHDETLGIISNPDYSEPQPKYSVYIRANRQRIKDLESNMQQAITEILNLKDRVNALENP